jgi:hypothetical protein
MMKRFPSPPRREARSRFGHNRSLRVGDAIKTFGHEKMFCTIRGEGGGRRAAVTARVGLLALAALAASGSASSAQDSGSLLKRGAKLLGFATDVAPPADFVQKSRPAGDVDFIPVFQAPPEPARPALKDTDLKTLKGDLETVQKQADAVRRAYPPAAKVIADQEAAKKKQQSNAPNPQQ